MYLFSLLLVLSPQSVAWRSSASRHMLDHLVSQDLKPDLVTMTGREGDRLIGLTGSEARKRRVGRAVRRAIGERGRGKEGCVAVTAAVCTLQRALPLDSTRRRPTLT